MAYNWGSFDLDTNNAQLAFDALQVGVFRFDPDSGYEALPNVELLRVDRREGCIPSSARFRYITDDALESTLGWPARAQGLFGLHTAPNPYVVRQDDRIVALAQNPDGSQWVLFDGFAVVPQADIVGGRGGEGRGSEAAGFTALGVEIRCWDSPITGRIQRDSDSKGIIDASGDSDVSTDLRCRFNPSNGRMGVRAGQVPNKTPKGKDTGSTDDEESFPRPVFVDAGISFDKKPGDAGAADYWTVPDGVKYLLGTENGDEEYVTNPPFGALDKQLQTYLTADGYDTISPDDPKSYKTVSVRIQDYDASNQPWPEAVCHVIAYCGFLARFDTFADEQGYPETALTFYRRDEFAALAPQPVYLDAVGQGLDPARNNARDIHIALDGGAIINAYQVETAQRLLEVSIVLAPLYQPAAADASGGARRQFRRANLAAAAPDVRRKYRWYGADENAQGHMDGINAGAEGFVKKAFDFLPFFPLDDDGDYTYVNRYRPGSDTLLSVDDDGVPRRADLSISFDYEGDWAAPWDGTGTWYSIRGGWRLLPDRLGIEVTVDDPEMWSTGADRPIGAGGAGIFGAGTIHGISWWASPAADAPTNGQAPSLRLTTVIEDDLRMPIAAPKRISSPTKFTRWRIADRRDDFVDARLHPSSMYFQALQAAGGGALAGAGGSDPIPVRDDTDGANALAEQLREAHANPVLSGTVTIPFITDLYPIGSRVQAIAGRDVSLQTNIGGDQGEAPTYPWVVSVSWNFDGCQETVLSLSDQHAVPRHGRYFDRRGVRHA